MMFYFFKLLLFFCYFYCLSTVFLLFYLSLLIFNDLLVGIIFLALITFFIPINMSKLMVKPHYFIDYFLYKTQSVSLFFKYLFILAAFELFMDFGKEFSMSVN